ncbi:hypothetical protein ON010_g10726 [Phytophthora cinnamomi]|nr:hypothetical protein ON010_g10726 [Phytophthora cinnamomi]
MPLAAKTSIKRRGRDVDEAGRELTSKSRLGHPAHAVDGDAHAKPPGARGPRRAASTNAFRASNGATTRTGRRRHGICQFTLNVKIRTSTRRGRRPRRLVRLGHRDARKRGAVSTATAGAGLTRIRLSASPELKEFQGRDASEDNARA